MATAAPESDDKICDTCAPKKTLAITSCHGCNRHFCRKHFNEHRDELTRNLNNHIGLHDEILQDLRTRIDRSSNDRLDDNDHARSLLQRIDEWEARTIDSCHHVAIEARASVRELFDQTKENDFLTQQLSSIARELEEQQQAENFTEHDLDRWMTQLKELKNVINQPMKRLTNTTIETRDIDWEESIKICQSPNANQNTKHYVLVLGKKGMGLYIFYRFRVLLQCLFISGKTTFIYYVANFFARTYAFGNRLSQTTIELNKKETSLNSHRLGRKFVVDQYSFSIDDRMVLVFVDYPDYNANEQEIKSATNLCGINQFLAAIMIGDGTDMEENLSWNSFVTNDLFQISRNLQEIRDFSRHFLMVSVNCSPSVQRSKPITYDNVSFYFMQNSAYQLYRARSLTDSVETDYHRSMQTIEQIIQRIVHGIRQQT